MENLNNFILQTLKTITRLCIHGSWNPSGGSSNSSSTKDWCTGASKLCHSQLPAIRHCPTSSPGKTTKMLLTQLLSSAFHWMTSHLFPSWLGPRHRELYPAIWHSVLIQRWIMFTSGINPRTSSTS